MAPVWHQDPHAQLFDSSGRQVSVFDWMRERGLHVCTRAFLDLVAKTQGLTFDGHRFTRREPSPHEQVARDIERLADRMEPEPAAAEARALAEQVRGLVVDVPSDEH